MQIDCRLSFFAFCLIRQRGITLVKYYCYKVKHPSYGASADDPDDTNDKKHVVFLIRTLDYTVYSPYDVENGDTKNKLDYKGEIVHHLDEILHSNSPFSKFG